MTTEPSRPGAFEAFRDADFDWTRQLKSVWTDPPYHVPSLHSAAIDDVMGYFKERTRPGLPEPLGKVIVGPAGFGKTHLIGELRRRVWAGNGWFVLLDFIGVKDFWSSVALGFLSSLQVRSPGYHTQYDRLFGQLIKHLKLETKLAAVFDRHQSNSPELVADVTKLFLSALAGTDRTAALEHRDVMTALVLMISEDLDHHSVAHAWLQGMDIDAGVAGPLGLRGPNAPMKVVEGLSWLMSLIGPTLIAIDQIDAIVSASNAQSRADALTQTKEEELEARSIVELLTQGLMDIHEKKRRAVTVLSCLEATWKVLQGATASVADRYQSPLSLETLKTRETAEALVAARLAPAYQDHGFTPPYPAWPFTRKALAAAAGYTPRQLLKRCEEFRRQCLAEGRVTECLSLEPAAAASIEPSPRAGELAAAFERELAAANVAPLLTAEGEDALRILLDCALQLLVKHFDLPDAIDAEAQRDPDQKRPSLHGRVSFTFHDEGDREQQYCFRVLQHTNAIAFQSRLKAAMTASGIDTKLKFRHLFILRNEPLPTGRKTETLLEQFGKSGGKILMPAGDDLRVFAALQALAKKDHPEFEAWLRAKKPLFETAFFKNAGLAPPPFLANGSSGSQTGGENGQGQKSAAPAETAGAHPETAQHKRAGSKPNQPGVENTLRRIPMGWRFEHGQPGDPVLLDAGLLPRHMAIIAGSGSGKTVLLRRVVEEAALLGIPAIVLDINNDLSRLGDRWPEKPADMTDEDADKAEAYHAHADVVIWTPGASSGRPLSLPLLPDFSRIGNDAQAEDERNQAIEMALATLLPYAGAGGQRGALKQGVLAAALRFFAREGTDSLADLIAFLSELPDGVSQIKDAYKLASGIADQLRAAVDTNPLLRSAGAKLDPAVLFHGANGKTRISVINFSGLASEAAKQAFVNQLQMALFTWIKSNPSPTGRLYVMDEAQNFAPSLMGTPCKASAKSLAAQARKYGLGMIFATQLPKGIDNGIVSNCTTHIYGRMSSPTPIAAIEDLIKAKGGEAHDIGRLIRGEFYFSTEGSVRPIKIRSPLCLSWHSPNPPAAEEVMEKARK